MEIDVDSVNISFNFIVFWILHANKDKFLS
jgi:hypothetical protein